jgi:hypothetical protein
VFVAGGQRDFPYEATSAFCVPLANFKRENQLRAAIDSDERLRIADL